MASRLELASGRKVFVKAMDAIEWPDQATWHRAEALVSRSLPRNVPAPRLLRWSDDGRWVVLVFECTDGREPDLRRNWSDAFRVAGALDNLATSLTPSLSMSLQTIRGWAAGLTWRWTQSGWPVCLSHIHGPPITSPR